MKYFNLEQQYIFNASIQKVFNIYEKYWGNLMNISTFYKKKDNRIGENDIDDLLKKIDKGYSYMYRQKGIVIVNLKSTRSTLKRIPSRKLSEHLKTTVVDLSIWESFDLTIADRGKILFSLGMYEPDDAIHTIKGSDPRFFPIIERIKEIKKGSKSKINTVYVLIGDDFENIFSIINFYLVHIVEPKREYLEEAVVFEIRGSSKSIAGILWDKP